MKIGTLVELKSPLLGNAVHARGVCFYNYGSGVQLVFENGEYDGFDKDEQEFYLQPIGFVEENSDYKFTNVLQVLRDFDKGYFNFKR